jgi:SAM-dependent methyltransferase
MDGTEAFRRWDSVYRSNDVETLPWYHKELDADVAEELEERSIEDGSFLDLGTGPGTQAIALSDLGFKVTATDISETAIRKARGLSSSVIFLQDDITDSGLTRTFDYVFDRGCFHTLEPEDRPRYIKTVRGLLRKGGLLFLKCFSTKEKSVEGPYRFSKRELERLFGRDFAVENVKETVFRGTLRQSPKALFAVMKRK